MGKVEFVKSARKERKCSKCGKDILKGNSYYKGVINFHPDIVRCCNCGLQYWEVTTSDFLYSVGEIANCWSELYGIDAGAVDELKDAIENLRDEQEEKLDNLPDSLRDAPTGELLQERYDNLDDVYNELDNIDMADIESRAIATACENADFEYDADEDLETFLARADIPDEIKDSAREEYESLLTEAIEDALSGLEF